MSKCRIVNRRLNGQFLASGAVDAQILDRIEHDKLLRELQQERRDRAKARREAMNGRPLSHSPFASLKGDK
jgi:hypothetical protein